MAKKEAPRMVSSLVNFKQNFIEYTTNLNCMKYSSWNLNSKWL